MNHRLLTSLLSLSMPVYAVPSFANFTTDNLSTAVLPKPAMPIIAPTEQDMDLINDDTMPTRQTQAHDLDLDFGLDLGTGMDYHINQALLHKNWQALAHILQDYPNSTQFDQLLYDYALGALYHAQGKYKQAIALYEHILQTHPQFAYIRFDLAVMQFENKQYKQAKQHFLILAKQNDSKLQPLIKQYLNAIEQRQALQPDIILHYEKNNNINNAASQRVIQWHGKTLSKSQDDLPKSATGIRYGIGASKSTNLSNNHFLYMDGQLQGVHYWDNQRYNEQNLQLQLGYQYQDHEQNLSILPFVDYLRQDGKPYSTRHGISLNAGHQISDKSKASIHNSYTTLSYANPQTAKNHNSQSHNVGFTASYAILPNVLLSGGADINQEDANNDEHSSTRYGVHLGVLAQHKNGMGGRFSVRVAKRDFKQPETLLYGFERKDKEYYLQSTLWHNQLNYKGFVPQLNIRHHKIDSNMAGFYSKNNTSAFISIDKKF